MQRKWQVLARHVGRRLHELPRRDDRQHRLPGHPRVASPAPRSRAVVDPHRVQHRLRGAARPGRAPGRPRRAPPPSSLGLLTFLAASAAAGLAPTVEVLVAARVVQAAGAAALVPTSLALLLPEFPLAAARDRDRRLGRDGAVAAAVGPSLGGAARRGELALGLLRQPRDRPPRADPGAPPAPRGARGRTRPAARRVGVALLVAGVALLSLGIVKGQDWGWGSAGVLGVARGRGRAAARFAARSARHPAPVIDPALFRVRSFAVANARLFAFALAFYAFLLGNRPVPHRRRGTSRSSPPGSASRPGPLMAARRCGGRRARSPTASASAPSPLPGGLLFGLGAASGSPPRPAPTRA